MSNVKIGWAQCDISTDKPVLILGQAHIRVSKGVHDPITATVFVIENGDCAIMVSADLMEFTHFEHDAILAKVAKKNPEIPTDHIFMGATHTHDGGPGIPDKYVFSSIDLSYSCPVTVETASCDEYIDFMAEQISDAICKAWNERSEGGIAYGYGYAVVGHSRRVRYFDDISKRGDVDATDTYAVNGHAAMYGNTNDDNFSSYEAGADHFINLLYTFDKAGKLTGAIVNVPCPSQNSESEWYLSASFWNEARQMLKDKYGDITVMGQCGPGGDIAPRILHYKQAQARRFKLKYGETEDNFTEMNERRDIAERIVSAFDEVLDWAKKDVRTDVCVKHKLETLPVERYQVSEEEYENSKKGYAAAMAKDWVTTEDHMQDFVVNTRLLSDRNRFAAVIKSYEERNEKPNETLEYHLMRIGDIAFVSTSFELYMDYYHRIQARSPFEQTFMIQLCAQPVKYGGVLGYVATERAVAGKGYSAIPFSCKVSPKGGQQFVENVIENLKEMR